MTRRPATTTATPARPAGRWRDAGLLALVVALIVLSRPLAHDPAITLVGGGALMLLACLGLGVREARHAPLWVSPLSFYFFWYTIGLGVSAIFYGQQVADGAPIGFYGGNLIDPEDLTDGYVIYVVGSAALYLGVQLTRPMRTSADGAPADGAPAITFGPPTRLLPLVALWALGVIIAWRSDLLASLGALAPLMSGAPLAALSCFALRDRRDFGFSPFTYYAVLLAGTAGLVLASLNSGSKAAIMFSLIPLAWHFVLRFPSARWGLPVGLVVAALVYFWMVGPLVTLARATAIREGEIGASGQRLLATIDDVRSGRSDLSSPEAGGDRLVEFVKRQFDPLPVGYIAGDVAQHGLDMGATMDYALYAFVPRVIWPDKPPVTRGSWFAVYIGAARSEATATVAVGLTAIGELYWNFGVPGVMVGMFIIGLIIGLLWRAAGADPRRNVLRMLLYVTLVLLMVSMAEAVSVMASLVAIGLAFAALWAGLSLLRTTYGLLRLSQLGQPAVRP